MGDEIRDVVQRKLRGLPASLEEPQVAADERCRDCGDSVAEKGTQAHAEGLCGDCASWRRRNNGWRNAPLF